MLNKKRVAKNTILISSTRICQYFALFLFMVYAARFLGAEDYGKLTFAIVFTNLFKFLADFGLGGLATFEVAGNKSVIGKFVRTSLFIKIIFSFFSFLLIVIIINILNYPEITKKIVYIFGIAVIIDSFVFFYGGLFKGTEKAEYEFYCVFWENPIILGGGLFCLHKNYGLISIAFVFLVAKLISLGLCKLIYLKKIQPATPSFIDLNYLKTLTKKTVPFALFIIFATIYSQIDTVMLSYISGDKAVGIYQCAIRIPLMFMIINHSLELAFLPTMTRNFHISKEVLETTHLKMIKILLLLGLPITIILMSLSEKIILFLYGESFRASIVVLQVVSIISILRYLTSAPATLITAINKQKIKTYIYIAASLINIALILILIPKYSYSGAMIAAVMTNSIVLIMHYVIISINGFKRWLKFKMCPILISSLMMFFIVNMLRDQPLFIPILLGLITYFLLLLITKSITYEEIKALQ